jgi:predicted ATPase
MKLTKLHATNFKSLADVEMAFDPSMTVLVGANNVGKSAILDALMFMSESATSTAQRTPSVWTPLMERGGYAAVAHGRELSNTISLHLELCGDASDLGAGLAVGETYEAISGEPVVCKFVVSLSPQQFDRFNVSVAIRGVEADLGRVDFSPSVSTPVEGLGGLQLNLAALRSYLGEFRHLQSFRSAQDEIGAEGGYRLARDGSNLIRVLNSLASGNGRLYGRILADLAAVIPGVDELRAPLVEGRNVAYGAITESAFGGVEFTWPHISSGTREIIMILTLAHTAPSPGVVLIEEPEARIHSAALAKLVQILEGLAAKQDKQFVITTHSPIVVDCASLEKVVLVSKRDGRTSLAKLADSASKLAREGILLSWLLFPGRRVLPEADFLLILEGRDDVKLWEKFLERRSDLEGRVRAIKGQDGGSNEAAKLGVQLKVFADMGLTSAPFLVVCDSDGDRAGKEAGIRQEGLADGEFHVLERKEIEDYLIDAKAIAAVTNKSEGEVEEAIADTKGAGKQKLEKVLKRCGIGTADIGIKLALTANMESLPEEIEGILDRISKAVSG